MPTYNMAHFIGDAIESILAQTYTNWELIIIDDGSIDTTHDVINKFQDTRIQYFHQENRGRGAARNKALSLAKGKYIAIADADDISLPNRFENQVNYLEKHSDCAVIGGQILHFTDREQPVSFVNYFTDAKK